MNGANEMLAAGQALSAFETLLGIDQSVLDTIPSGVCICSADGALVRYNRQAAELWGRSPSRCETDERFCGAFQLYQLDGQLLPHARSPMAVALRTGEPQLNKEVVVGRPDGSQVIIRVSIELLRSPVGRVQGAINCFQDITDDRKTEKELRESQSGLEDFFDNAVVAMHWVNAEGTIVRANQAELDLLGYARDEYIGRHIAEFHADQSAIEKILASLSNRERLDKVPAKLMAKNGTIKHVLISSSARIRDGKLVNTRCVTLDVSSEQLAYLLSAIVGSSEDAIVSKDLNGIITSWNQGAERLFGYTAEEAIGKSVTMIMSPDRHAEEADILQQIRRGERIAHFETLRRRKDGSPVDVSLTISPVKDSEGRVIGASKIARDITERKKADEHRRLLIDELDHRVKNTLAIVQSVAHQTFRGDAEPLEARKSFEGRLAALASVHNLLARENWEKAFLHDIADEVICASEPTSDRVSMRGPPVVLQPKQAGTVAIALHELCTNAVKYGALSNDAGGVTLEWDISDDPDPHLNLTWREHGGPAVSPPKRRGFGSRIIEQALAQELNGNVAVKFRPEGLVCFVEAPLPG